MSGSTLLAAAGVLPLVAVRLQPHRSTVNRSRPLPVPLPPPPQRSQPFTPTTPPLKSTPLQPLGLFGSISQWKSRLQRCWDAERAAAPPLSPLMMEPQQRGWIEVGWFLLWLGKKNQQILERGRLAGGAEHWDLQAYKRGGGLGRSQRLPRTASHTIRTPDHRSLMINGLPLYLRQHSHLIE